MRANLAEDIADYPWSSYRERCLLSEASILEQIVVGGGRLNCERGAG